METIEALPAVVASMAAIAPGKSLHLGPSSIGMRHNPYGAATAPNPDRKRIAMADDDPRQAGLFAAAWTVGYVAAIAGSAASIAGSAAAGAGSAVATVAVNHLAGPQGITSAADGHLYPVFHVMRALTEAGGKPRVPVTVEGQGIAALAWRDGKDRRLLVANQTASPVSVTLPAGLRGNVLDARSFDAAAKDPAWQDGRVQDLGATVVLEPCAVLLARS